MLSRAGAADCRIRRSAIPGCCGTLYANSHGAGTAGVTSPPKLWRRFGIPARRSRRECYVTSHERGEQAHQMAEALAAVKGHFLHLCTIVAAHHLLDHCPPPAKRFTAEAKPLCDLDLSRSQCPWAWHYGHKSGSEFLWFLDTLILILSGSSTGRMTILILKVYMGFDKEFRT